MQALTAAPRTGLLAADVAEALSLGRGAQVRHGVELVNTSGQVTGTLRTAADAGTVTWSYRAPDRVTGQSDSIAAVRRRASLNVPHDPAVNLHSAWLRVWTDWRLRAGGWARFYLGTFVVVNPGAVTDDGVRLTRTLELADLSYLWANRYLTEPVTVAAGTVAIDYVRTDLATRFGATTFALPTSTAALPLARTFETGTPWLEVYSRVLEAAGFDQLTADEQGRPSTTPLADLVSRGVEQTYGAGRGKVVTAGQVEPLLPTLPNVVRFSARQGPSLGNVEGNGLRTVRNQSTGPASIDKRGVEVELRVDVDAANQTALDAIAYADAQRYFAGGGERWSGRIALNPRHSDRDVIALELPRLGLSEFAGAWLVTDWTYPLQTVTSDAAVTMSVTAERRVVTS